MITHIALKFSEHEHFPRVLVGRPFLLHTHRRFLWGKKTQEIFVGIMERNTQEIFVGIMAGGGGRVEDWTSGVSLCPPTQPPPRVVVGWDEDGGRRPATEKQATVLVWVGRPRRQGDASRGDRDHVDHVRTQCLSPPDGPDCSVDPVECPDPFFPCHDAKEKNRCHEKIDDYKEGEVFFYGFTRKLTTTKKVRFFFTDCPSTRTMARISAGRARSMVFYLRCTDRRCCLTWSRGRDSGEDLDLPCLLE